MKKKQKAPKRPTASKATPSSRASTSSTASPSKWIRTDRPIPLPGYAKDALTRLDEAGHLAYVVGGSVRDFLLSRETKDHDIATSAGPDELERLFPNAITVGKEFGVLKIPVEGGPLLEIATFREDLEYRDHRHPTGILFSGPAEDARRRDFTVNALFYDPKTVRVLDFVGGLDDLKAKVIRAIGDPMERFREDALRLLRAVRFTTTLGFALDPKTAEAAKARAKLIAKVSAERVRDELTLMLMGPRPAEAVRWLAELGLLAWVLPEVDALKAVAQPSVLNPEGMEKDVFRQTLKVVDWLARKEPRRTPIMAWASLLHGVGKASAARKNGGKNFNGFDIDGAKIARSICDRLKMSRADSEAVSGMIEDQLKFKEVFQMREATLQRFIREPYFEERLALHRADAAASDGNLAFYEFCASRLAELRALPPDGERKLVSGEDLIQLGLRPGPRFSEILRTIDDLTLERKLSSKEEALEYVVRHFVR